MRTLKPTQNAPLLGLLLALLALPAGLAGCSSDGCDDPTPALCVHPRSAQGSPIVPTRVEAFQGGKSVEKIQCSQDGFECCSSGIETGTYRVEVEVNGMVQARDVSVTNTHDCSHPVANETFTF
jgi:hypothetical protein